MAIYFGYSVNREINLEPSKPCKHGVGGEGGWREGGERGGFEGLIILAKQNPPWVKC
jgi:hypothetical protein